MKEVKIKMEEMKMNRMLRRKKKEKKLTNQMKIIIRKRNLKKIKKLNNI